MIEAKNVTFDSVVGEAMKMKTNGYRFVTMTCVDIDENTFDILYHFDKNSEIKHLRLSAPKAQNVPSLSSVYFCALLIENEMQDQFGVKFDNLVLNFNGTLYLEEESTRTPFCRYSTVTKQ